MRTFLKAFCVSIICGFFLVGITSSFAATPSHPVFTKVIFFGDSLTDVGNNEQMCVKDAQHPDTLVPCIGQAPDTNDSILGPKGAVWAIPFVHYLQDNRDLQKNPDPWLSKNNSLVVDPSVDIEENIAVRPGGKDSQADNVDFAYSGDPSGGVISKGEYQNHPYHPIDGATHFCVNTPMPGGGSNALCGLYNRLYNYTKNMSAKALDSDALYVIWIGANDISQGIGPYLANKILNTKDLIVLKNGVPTDRTLYLKTYDTVSSTLFNIQSSINDLIQHGAKYFMVVGLPNLGYTPQGFYLNEAYYKLRGLKPILDSKGIVNQLYYGLTQQFNSNLTATLNMIRNYGPYKSLGVKIYQPDINVLFNQARNGRLAAFPPKTEVINKTNVASWAAVCCHNKMTAGGDLSPNYDPKSCVPMAGYETLCPMGVPQAGIFLFFNAIHPTTCVHKYLAKYFVEAIKSWPATPMLSTYQNVTCP